MRRLRDNVCVDHMLRFSGSAVFDLDSESVESALWYAAPLQLFSPLFIKELVGAVTNGRTLISICGLFTQPCLSKYSHMQLFNIDNTFSRKRSSFSPT